MGFEPTTSGTDHRCSTNCVTRPDGSWSWEIKMVICGKWTRKWRGNQWGLAADTILTLIKPAKLKFGLCGVICLFGGNPHCLLLFYQGTFFVTLTFSSLHTWAVHSRYCTLIISLVNSKASRYSKVVVFYVFEERHVHPEDVAFFFVLDPCYNPNFVKCILKFL